MSSIPSKVDYSEREMNLLRFFRDKYLAPEVLSQNVTLSLVPKQPNETKKDLHAICHRFEKLGLLSWINHDCVEVKQVVIDLLHELENPPTRNHLSEWTNWWFGKPWRAAISAIIIILPLIVQWVEMLKTVLNWMLSINDQK